MDGELAMSVRQMGAAVEGAPVPMLDQALRYRPVIDRIEDLGVDRVLEVGSGASGLAAWWPGPVVGVDLRFDGDPPPNLTVIDASATDLPFPDGSFPLVVCTDVFEHLPATSRPQAFAELLRVSSRYVWLAFPSGPDAERHDRWIARLCGLTRRERPGWLCDHMDYGLPAIDEVSTWPIDGYRRASRQRVAWWLHFGIVSGSGLPGGSTLGRIGQSARACRVIARIPGRGYRYENWLERAPEQKEPSS